MIETRYLAVCDRVNHGKARERQIADALKNAGLKLVNATDDEDKNNKIDRWLVKEDGSRVAVQIKYRETGDDLLFEVFDRWNGWDHPGNKIGRDLRGESKIYAVLKKDKRTIVLVPTDLAKKIISTAVQTAENYGWTQQTDRGKTLKYFKHGLPIELKVQSDPSDGRQKMVAYIPAGVFEAEAQLASYKVKLPENWKKAV